MISTEQLQTATVRTNSEGDPCPSWCDTDHAKYAFHGSPRVAFNATNFYRYSASAVRFLDGDKIAVAGAGQFYVEPEAAVDLAELLDNLATAKPQDLHALADVIRQAAAAIKPPADLASCGHPRNDDGECDCASWPERAPII